MIFLRQVSLQRGVKVLLDEADLTVSSQYKMGIVGANGAGKSSLFQMLLGGLQPDKGSVEVVKNTSLAHLKQELPDTDMLALEYALLGDEEYTELNRKLKIAEQEQDGLAMADIHMRLAEIDGYAAESRAAIILKGLGFSDEQQFEEVNAFSGGWRMRLNLAQVLISRADILLLDEPTNHLDLEGIIWLGNFLKKCPSTILVISHDREFLDDVVGHIAFLDNQKITTYTGNYSAFEKEYAMQLTLQQAAYEKQQKKREHLQKFVDRFRAKATKAKQAQSRLKMLERMEMVSAVREKIPFRFSFSDVPPGGTPMLTMRNVSCGYGDEPILKGVTVNLSDGDRIGLLGLNGAGKSTFIKLLADRLEHKKGPIFKSKQLTIGYFAQHQLDELDKDANALTHMYRLDPKISEKEARSFLGGFLFTGDQVFAPIARFSGGEKSRLALALLIWQKPNLLLLDEPTNHLDMDMREALMMALQEFSGAMILVSHDRYLLKSLVNEFYLVHDGKVTPYEGDIEDYRTVLD